MPLESAFHYLFYLKFSFNRVSTTPGNPGNLLEFKWSSWKFLCNDYCMVNGFTT